MTSKTYTARELLRMRRVSGGKELYNKLAQKLWKDSDLGEIFRMSSDRPLPLIEEEVPESDLEISEEAPVNSTSVRQLDGTDAEWKYRGRTESEAIQKQPIGAPAGTTAQKDEGFQRFYKAVVSPTHVRVTAGGRIVPNTRGGCSSPTARWAKEKPDNEGSYHQGPLGRTYGESGYVPMTQPIFGPVHQIVHGYGHPFPQAVMPGPQPIPMMPLHMGVGMPGLFGIMAPNAMPATTSRSTARSTMSPGASDGGCELESPAANTPLRISPPEQFDHNRPFVYNGQLMMPTGGTICSYPMPAPGSSFPSFPGTPMVQPRFGFHQVVQPAMKHGTPMHSRMASSSTTTAASGVPNVPVSSIRPSDITKKQLEVLRSALRYFEDQLQYNKHQIDEKGIEGQAQMVRDQIRNFERTLADQLENEHATYPATECQNAATNATLPDDQTASTTSTQAGRTEAESCTDVSSLPCRERVGSRKRWSESRTVTRPIKSNSAPVSTKLSPESSEDNEPVKKLSALPVSAALAPPFQPRSESTVSAPAPRPAHLCSRSSIEAENYEQRKTSSSELTTAGADKEQPYLVGSLPAETSNDAEVEAGYLYCRDLTEDELRARHMYWGKAPRHLQKGLPKFDGKDFYPPSPVKNSQKASVHSEGHTSNTAIDDDGSAASSEIQKPRSNSFQPSGHSTDRHHRYITRSMTKPEQSSCTEEVSRTSTAAARRSPSKVDRSYDKFRRAFTDQSDSSIDGVRDKSSDDGDDGTNILFKGRKFMAQNGNKTRNQILHTVLKRGKSTAVVVPGSVSSMTARGVLPNYAGYARASLTPTIANAAASPTKSSLSLLSAENTVAGCSGRRSLAENRPPVSPKLTESHHSVDG